MGIPWAVIALVINGVLVCIVVAVVIMIARRKSAEPTPRCGNCGYNLTGAPSNRCPECGKLFVEAGVVTDPAPVPRPRVWLPVLILLIGAFVALVIVFSAARRRALPPPPPPVASAPSPGAQPAPSAEE
jgi:hypothetical protein